jgi:hypothetical protein
LLDFVKNEVYRTCHLERCQRFKDSREFENFPIDGANINIFQQFFAKHSKIGLLQVLQVEIDILC